MRSKKTKGLVLALALLMLVSALFSCGKKKPMEPGDNTTTEDQNTNTADLYDSKGYLKDHVPELDYNNYEFKILSWDSFGGKDFWVESLTNEVISDSIYRRNKAVEDRLNLSIWTDSIPGNYDNRGEFLSYATNATMMGNKSEYDLIASYSMVGGSLATNGISANLLDLQYLDFANPWWSDSLVETSKIGNRLYFATGDLANSFFYAINFMVVNLNMLTENHLDDPRQMVKENVWTFDKLVEMTKDIGTDLDDEVGMGGVGDQYGFAGYSSTITDGWLSAAGIRMSDDKNEDQLLALTKDFVSEKTYNVIGKVNTWFWDSGDCRNTFNKDVILNGHALFGAVAGEVMPRFADVSFKYGVVPYPKFFEGQEQYNSMLGFVYTAFSIPVTADDVDRSAAVLECMNSQAYRSSAPFLYQNVVKYKYSNDPIDAEMFDIIKAGAYVDACRVFNASFQGAQNPVFLFRNAINGNKTTWMSDIGKIELYVNNILQNVTDAVG